MLMLLLFLVGHFHAVILFFQLMCNAPHADPYELPYNLSTDGGNMFLYLGKQYKDGLVSGVQVPPSLQRCSWVQLSLPTGIKLHFRLNQQNQCQLGHAYYHSRCHDGFLAVMLHMSSALRVLAPGRHPEVHIHIYNCGPLSNFTDNLTAEGVHIFSRFVQIPCQVKLGFSAYNAQLV